MPTRIIAAISAPIGEPGKFLEAAQGEEVDLTDEQEASLEAQKALVPPHFDSFEAFHQAKQDAYRAGRGDIEAATRLADARAGGIVDLSVPGGDQTGDYINWLRSEEPTVDEVLAEVGDDPAKANAMLEAEQTVSGGEPRKGVVDGLTKITEG